MGYAAQLVGVPVDFSNTSTITGYTTSPTTNGWYVLNGKQCTVFIDITGSAPTSNSTTKTCTLPFAAFSDFSQRGIVLGIDNTSTNISGSCATIAGSNVLNVYTNSSQGGWTASGTGRFRIILTYIIA